MPSPTPIPAPAPRKAIIAVASIIAPKNTSRILTDLLSNKRMPFQESLEVVMLGQISFVIDQLWIVLQFSRYSRVVLHIIVKLIDFIS